MFLRSLLLIKQRNKIHVNIVGDGPSRKALQKFVSKKGLDKMITWHGYLPREKAVKLFNEAHMHVITSISEGNPTVIWESMSYGVPTLSLDHCGMHDTIDDKSGIRIPIHSYKQCVEDIATVVDSLLSSPDKFKELSEGVIQRAKLYTWDERERFLLKCYDQTIENYKNRTK